MINYMLAPLDKHFDLGFGFTGNTFRGAAESLVAKEDKSYFGDAPISYLQRHAIELYLKSAIIILFKLNGNSIDANDNKSFPKVISNGKEKPIFNVHSISELFNHLCIELNSMEALLKEKSEICWNFSKEFKSNIQIIENNDPSSTFFRYPVIKEKGDEIKSPSIESSEERIINKIKSNTGPVKAFLIYDDDENLVSAYELRKSIDKQISSALNHVLNDLYGFHAATRGELTGGW